MLCPHQAKTLHSSPIRSESRLAKEIGTQLNVSLKTVPEGDEEEEADGEGGAGGGKEAAGGVRGGAGGRRGGRGGHGPRGSGSSRLVRTRLFLGLSMLALVLFVSDDGRFTLGPIGKATVVC